MNRRIAIALAAIAGLAATASVASATETVWPTGGGDTNWIGLETAPAVTPNGGLAIVRRVSGNNDNLVRLDSSGWITSTGPNLTLATNVPSGGVTADSAGNVYMSSDNSGVYSRVVKISPDNTTSTVWQQSVVPVYRYIQDPILIDGRGRLVFMAVDDVTPYVYRVVRVNPDGSGAEEFQPTVPNDNGVLAVDQQGNTFMALDGAGGSPARVMKISAEGVMTQLATLPNASPRSIVAGPDGTLHVAYYDGTLGRISPQGVVTAVAGVTLCGHPVFGILDAAGVEYLSANCGNPEARTYAISPDNAIAMVGTFSGEYMAGKPALDGLGHLYVPLSISGGASRIVRISSGGGTPDIAPAPPAVPQAPTAAAGDRAATVTVPSPTANAQFGTPTAYEVSAVEDSAKSCTITLPATSCTVTGLTGGTRYTFVAKARLLSWLTPASAASGAVVPTAPSPAPTPTPPVPAKLGASVKCSGASCTTTGRLPAGATRVTQSATTGSRANAVAEIFARKSVKGTCRLSPAKVKGKKVKNRTYTCRIRLSKGTWTLTTSAFAGSRTVATSSRKVTVRR